MITISLVLIGIILVLIVPLFRNPLEELVAIIAIVLLAILFNIPHV